MTHALLSQPWHWVVRQSRYLRGCPWPTHNVRMHAKPHVPQRPLVPSKKQCVYSNYVTCRRGGQPGGAEQLPGDQQHDVQRLRPGRRWRALPERQPRDRVQLPVRAQQGCAAVLCTTKAIFDVIDTSWRMSSKPLGDFAIVQTSRRMGSKPLGALGRCSHHSQVSGHVGQTASCSGFACIVCTAHCCMTYGGVQTHYGHPMSHVLIIRRASCR